MLRRPRRDPLPAVFSRPTGDVLSFRTSRFELSDAQLGTFVRPLERTRPVPFVAAHSAPRYHHRLPAPPGVHLRPARRGEPMAAAGVVARPVEGHGREA